VVAVAVAVAVGEGVTVGATVAVAVAVGVEVAVGAGVPVGVGDPVAPTVVSVKLHPPANEPRSPGPSSNTYSDHVPFADCPLNADNAVAYGPAGAGRGKLSPPGEVSE
jgi:hypothetical protein